MVKKKSLFKQKNFFSKNGYPILSAILLLAIIAVLVVSLGNGGVSDQQVVQINGQSITEQDILDRMTFNLLFGAQESEERVLENLVTEILLFEEAQRRGISFNSQEVDEEYNMILSLNNIPELDLITQLESVGLGLDYFKDYFKTNLYVSTLVDSLVEDLEVSDEDVREYFDTNTEQFLRPESMVVRHILISNDFDDYQNIAFDVRSQILDDLSNFCELVEQHTNDPASTPNCGEYQVTQDDPFVEEFKQAAFDMEIGEIRNVETSFGIHIMVKDDVLPESQLLFEDVQNNIRQFLIQNKSQQIFQDLLVELESQAVISN